ncbi:hypothetical protein SAMN04487995_0378 [Dyadobacter koreensis]|uniref:Uncharacterized protein n=1 Tax=Dyadobacter koreensis TaxID=408657 RepID=A0A1H6QK93_9BACT|nr:hypothetical protein [Dyadobacter koreensis]SEI39705.1 hypothetical protein SAMN04487995_0378 [Dyadobacter koreensis]
MRISFLMLLFTIAINPLLSAQRLREWLQQNRTQKQYLETQIAELKIYLELTEKGYRLAKEGLTTISNLKESEFSLHKNRFDSLWIVSASIRGSPRLRQITDMHGKLNQICQRLPSELSEKKHLNSAELDYSNRVFSGLYQEGQKVLIMMLSILGNGNFQMDDQQRLVQLEKCFQKMQAAYIAAARLSGALLTLDSQRRYEEMQIQTRRALTGIN